VIVILDYGAGNLRSVINAVSSLGYQPCISNQPADVYKADALILPGVGAAGDTMTNLSRLSLIEPIKDYISQSRPFLGICIGMQILFTHTEEGNCDCLNILPGQVRRFPEGPKIPHMGWNQVKQKKFHPIFEGIPDNTNFYFVHSYYVTPEDRSIVAGETDYNITFCSVVVRDKLVATQFHPEKSGRDGLRFYQNFFKLAKG